VTILTDDGWRSLFGSDPSILGQTVEFDGVPTEVVGVMPASFAFLERSAGALEPLYVNPEGQFGAFGQSGIARLGSGVSLEQAGARMSDLQSRIPERFDMSQEFLD